MLSSDNHLKWLSGHQREVGGVSLFLSPTAVLSVCSNHHIAAVTIIEPVGKYSTQWMINVLGMTTPKRCLVTRLKQNYHHCLLSFVSEDDFLWTISRHCTCFCWYIANCQQESSCLIDFKTSHKIRKVCNKIYLCMYIAHLTSQWSPISALLWNPAPCTRLTLNL